MNALVPLLLSLYVVVMAVICLYGAHRYWMVWLFLRARRRGPGTTPPGRFGTLPAVTVQLPMFNEKQVAERVIEAACAIDYPRDRLQVQVLDDSTDDSAGIARRCCERLAGRGHDVEYRHREHRDGFKAGALAAGLETASGEFVAVFDADFVPPADILQRTIHHFTDDRIGMVQTRWSHLNRDDSLLTRVQAMFLDGHFVVEQTARAASGCWFNFNGTAGVWRRTCIDDAGGWQHDTLTEDADLSYRAQLAGWDFAYLADVTCPAELPPTVSAFLGQQHRWNKGLIQTSIKLLPRILTGPASLRRKIEAWFHLTSPVVHLAILLLVLLAIPALFVQGALEGVEALAALALGTLVLGLGTAAAVTFYVVSQSGQPSARPLRRIVRIAVTLPVLLAYGIGISVVNSRAVIEACLGHRSPFVRTPKFNGAAVGDIDPVLLKRPRRLPAGLVEIGLGVAMLACFLVALGRPTTLIGAPFLLLFASGYLAVGLPGIHTWWRRTTVVPG